MTEIKAKLTGKSEEEPKKGLNKLITNLNNKTNYTIHYRNLQYYIKKGLILKKVHKVLSFDQKPLMKDYINYNTTRRATTKNECEKDLFKLFNNSIFGKTCENVEGRIDVKLVTEAEKFTKYTNKPYFKNFEIFNNNLVAVELNKTQVLYNKPIIIGFSVLELSKLLMYEFHYDTIKKRYGDKAKLLFTDTDSLTYHIETEDIYQDLKENTEAYDFSDYPTNHILYSNENKKVIGKFKCETNGKIISEFAGLRSKMYSFTTEEGKTAHL